MASYTGNSSVTATLAAATVDTVTLLKLFNSVTVINESSTGVISFTIDGSTPTAGGNDTYSVPPNSPYTVRMNPRLQGESSGVNGVASVNRTDSVTFTSGSATVLDPSIVSADAGKKVSQIPGFLGLPPGALFVGTVVNATSFVLLDARGNAVPAVFTGPSKVTVHSVTTTASGSVFVPGVDPANVLSNVAVNTFPSSPFLTLISAGTPTYTVIGN